ncbi:cytochrome c oxidase subunit IV [Ceraceosorus guamensis]|uniref:Cytochrome c oxidase subunit IV n=1 Tax=Ceraceosorus guamensis TaxID=1522189 RepID=A0A316W4W0_9BASI|nr:cytochrome c oxidase subunit IV [Ceraceosorus guamensis]PWN44168.1 cytochrome c oxidase subunit IV [Ceraceosorus guamensis]
MLATGLRTVSRIAPRTASRGLLTKAEEWTPQMVKEIEANGAPSVDLKATLPNIEARWSNLSKEEQYTIYRKLEEVQRRDWKELSLDEKKAAYYISFGPHGPRKPITQPGQAIKTAAGVTGLIIATFGLFFGLRQFANPNQPKTMTKEYQEQSNELARQQNQNPITGISSEGYKGEGHVQKSYV